MKSCNVQSVVQTIEVSWIEICEQRQHGSVNVSTRGFWKRIAISLHESNPTGLWHTWLCGNNQSWRSPSLDRFRASIWFLVDHSFFNRSWNSKVRPKIKMTLEYYLSCKWASLIWIIVCLWMAQSSILSILLDDLAYFRDNPKEKIEYLDTF